MAKQYGITFDSVATSEMSGSFDPFSEMNHRMRNNFANYADRAYLRFKTLVGDGRKMDLDTVESIAQGRVWTGEQAKQIGLVDELGGLDRAIAYCQRNFTSSGDAVVVSWPPKQSLVDYLMKRRRQSNDDDDDDFENVNVPAVFEPFFSWRSLQRPNHMGEFVGRDCGPVVGSGGASFPLALSGMMATADENAAIRCLLEEKDVPTDVLSNFPPGFWD